MHKDSGQRGQGGMHSDHFFQWCAEHGVDSATSRAGLSAIDRLDFGADTEHVCVEYFFGGRERIAQLTAFLQRMKAHGAVLCILTNGETAVIHRHFTTVLSAWAHLFSGGWVGNIHDEYFITEDDGSVGSIQRGLFGIGRRLPVDSSKEQILERYWGGQSSARIVLVDDSITRDPAWSVTSSEAVPGLTLVDLPHEHGGLDGAHMRQILELIERL